MASSQPEHYPVSPLAEHPSLQPPWVSGHMASDDDHDARREKRSRFEEDLNQERGIPMTNMPSVKSPAFTPYSETPPPGMENMHFPISPPRPPFARAPDTLYSFGSNITRTRTDAETERLIAYRATQSAQWHIHWRIPALILFCFLMGIILALLQHFLYTWLHHQHIADEGSKFRAVLYGRALAYLSKVAFCGCVILVYRQRIWRSFRERTLSVLTIDQMFGATEDPRLLVNWEAWTNGPLIVAISIVIWVIPLATIIFSPGALTFGSFLETETLSLNVPFINFTEESIANWRDPITTGSDGNNKRSVMYYNTTDAAVHPTTPGWFDYYDQPSAELNRITLLLAYGDADQPTLQLNARQQACGGAYNCTYEQSFIGPGYECLEAASGINDTGTLKDWGAPFDMSVLVPRGHSVFYSDVDLGEYARPQPGVFQKGPGGIPVGTPDPDLGVFKAEPVLWLGMSTNSTVALNPGDPFAQNWTHRYDPKILKCTHKETNYTVKWNFTEPYFNTTVTRQYLAPIVDTNLTIGSDGKPNATSNPEPSQNWISPRTDVGLYKKTAAYHAIGSALRGFLQGHVDLEAPLPGPSYATVYSDITKTSLVSPNSEPKKNLSDEIELFYSYMVLSILSNPEMLAFNSSSASVNRSRYVSSFVYYPIKLWQCYAPVIFVVFWVMIFGAFTIWQDGTTFSTGFSRILVTTRNTTLDDISRGACLGNDPFPMELMHTRLKFGVLTDGNEVQYGGAEGYPGIAHCAFGVPSEVAPIRKGAAYAGLPHSSTRQRKTFHNDDFDEKEDLD